MSLLKQFLRKIQMENKEITTFIGEETVTIPPVKPSSYGEFDQLLGVTATQLCNIIIDKSIKEDLPLNLMKLQRIMYLIACLYQKRHRKILYTERFQPWNYGPVLGTLNDKFDCLNGKDISVYSTNAKNEIIVPALEKMPDLKDVVDVIWANTKGMTGVQLSRLIVASGKNSAWERAMVDHRPFISNVDMAEDETYLDLFGLNGDGFKLTD